MECRIVPQISQSEMPGPVRCYVELQAVKQEAEDPKIAGEPTSISTRTSA
jgi:hypothetical protein